MTDISLRTPPRSTVPPPVVPSKGTTIGTQNNTNEIDPGRTDASTPGLGRNSDELKSRAYDSYNFNNVISFDEKQSIRRTVTNLISQKLSTNAQSELTKEEIRELSSNILQLGGLSQLDQLSKSKFIQATGIESDENLAIINNILNHPNFNRFPSSFTAMDLLKICKELKAKNMSDSEIKEIFLDPLLSKMGNIEEAKTHIKETCMANKITFHDNLLKDSNRYDPFLSSAEAVRKGNEEERLTPLIELKGQQVTTSQHNSGVIEVLAGFLGYNRNTSIHEQILTVSLPKFIVDEMKAARTEEDLRRIFDKYETIIRQAMPQNTDQTPQDSSSTLPPAVEENKENIPDENVVSNPESVTANNASTAIQNVNDLKAYLRNNENSISAEKIALIANKIASFGGMRSLDSETKQILKSNLGIETDENIRVISEIVSDRNYSTLSRVFNAEQLLDLCKRLKEKGLSDSEIKLVFLDGLLSAVKSGNVDRAKEHIKDACKEQGIVFNPELHTPEYACNPFLNDSDKRRISEWENQSVSILEVRNENIERRDRHGGVLGFLLGAVGLNTSTSSNSATANVMLPRYIVNEIKNAQSEEEVRKIAEKYKDIIVNSFQVTQRQR